MIFIRRDTPPTRRFVALRVGLFFLAAGLWLAGVMIGSDLITAIAMGIAAITFFFGMYLRRQVRREMEEAEFDEAQGEAGW